MLQYSFHGNPPPTACTRRTAGADQPWVDYSPIIKRPTLRWRDAKRLALWICPCVLYYEYMPEANPWLNAWARMAAPDVMGYGRQEYGARVGFWRILDVLDRFDVRATAIANTGAFHLFPDVAAAVKERRWDVVGHGRFNSRFIYGQDRAGELAHYRQMREEVEELVGVRMSGMGGPGPQAATENTPDLIAEAGYTFFTDFFMDEQPFPINVRRGRLISMPYSVEVNDSPVLGIANEGAAFRDIVKRQFDQLYADSEHDARVMCISIHPALFGQPQRIRYLEEALEYVLSFDGVWQATGTEIADHYFECHYEAMLAHLANRKA